MQIILFQMWDIQTKEFGCTVPWIDVQKNNTSNICHSSRMNGTIKSLLKRFEDSLN